MTEAQYTKMMTSQAERIAALELEIEGLRIERDMFYENHECGYCGTRFDSYAMSFPLCPRCETPMDAGAMRHEIERLREALQSIIDENPRPISGYGIAVIEIAKEALAHNSPLCRQAAAAMEASE